jgi:hypothetical protein
VRPHPPGPQHLPESRDHRARRKQRLDDDRSQSKHFPGPTFLVKQVPGLGLEQRESGKTVLYLPIVTIILISYYYILL